MLQVHEHLKRNVSEILLRYLSPLIVESILASSTRRAGIDLMNPQRGDQVRLIRELKRCIRLYLKDLQKQRDCSQLLEQAVVGDAPKGGIQPCRVVVSIDREADIVEARSIGRALCQQVGARKSLEIKVATVVSELARNIVQYTSGGNIEVEVLDTEPPKVRVTATDNGPGIVNLQSVLNGKYKSKTGMGKGLIFSKNVMDDFKMESTLGKGTRVVVSKSLES